MTRLYSYILGFVLSLILTLVPAMLVVWHEQSNHLTPSHEFLYAAFCTLAVLQLGVQLYFFLHVGRERGPKWNTSILCFAAVVVAILMGGTLWIMHSLAHLHTDPSLPFIGGAITPQGSND